MHFSIEYCKGGYPVDMKMAPLFSFSVDLNKMHYHKKYFQGRVSESPKIQPQTIDYLSSQLVHTYTWANHFMQSILVYYQGLKALAL